MTSHKSPLYDVLSRIQKTSPAERLFAEGIYNWSKSFLPLAVGATPNWKSHVAASDETLGVLHDPDSRLLDMAVHWQARISGTQYVCDFALAGRYVTVGVEIDGQDFHSAEKDHPRDLVINRARVLVVRWPASLVTTLKACDLLALASIVVAYRANREALTAALNDLVSMSRRIAEAIHDLPELARLRSSPEGRIEEIWAQIMDEFSKPNLQLVGGGSK